MPTSNDQTPRQPGGGAPDLDAAEEIDLDALPLVQRRIFEVPDPKSLRVPVTIGPLSRKVKIIAWVFTCTPPPLDDPDLCIEIENHLQEVSNGLVHEYGRTLGGAWFLIRMIREYWRIIRSEK